MRSKHNQRDGPIANSLMHQLCSHSAIYPAAHSTYDTSLRSTYLTNTGNLFPNEFLLEKVGTSEMVLTTTMTKQKHHHRPVLATSANILNKLPDDSFSTGSMGHFWMKLDAIDGFRLVGHRSVGCRFSMSNDMEVWRRL